METELSSSTSLSPLAYASLGRRFLAFLIDAMILSIPGLIGAHILPIVGGLIVWFFYAPVLEASAIRATIGKHLLGIQVCDQMGRRISVRASLARNFIKLIETPLVFFGFFFALFSRRRQALHDMLAETFVVYGRTERPIVDAWTDGVRDVFASAKSAGIVPGVEKTSSSVTELERLQSLREKGALTEEEFQAAKRRVLGL